MKSAPTCISSGELSLSKTFKQEIAEYFKELGILKDNIVPIKKYFMVNLMKIILLNFLLLCRKVRRTTKKNNPPIVNSLYIRLSPCLQLVILIGVMQERK